MQLYHQRRLKQRRKEFIPKGGSKAGNAVCAPALSGSAAHRNRSVIVIIFKIRDAN